MVGEICGVEEFTQKLVGRVFDHLHLFDDHLLFTSQIVFIKTRVGYEISEKLKSLWQRGIDHFHGKAGDFMGGVRIQVSAQPIRLHGNLTGRTPPCSFEQSMLDEVTDAVQRRRFVA